MSETKELPVTKNNLTDLALGEHQHYYHAKAFCSNCQLREHIYIRKGTPMKSISKECERCGCAVNFDGGTV